MPFHGGGGGSSGSIAHYQRKKDMTLVNLKRDMTWPKETTNLGTPSASVAKDAKPVVITDNTVYTTHGYSFNIGNYAGTAGNMFGFGIKMQWIEGAGPIPYRIKCTSDGHGARWGYAWSADAAAEPALDANSWRICGIGQEYEDIWCITEAAGWSADNLIFFGQCEADTAQAFMSISVQRLLGMPNQYSAGVY